MSWVCIYLSQISRQCCGFPSWIVLTDLINNLNNDKNNVSKTLNAWWPGGCWVLYRLGSSPMKICWVSPQQGMNWRGVCRNIWKEDQNFWKCALHYIHERSVGSFNCHPVASWFYCQFCNGNFSGFLLVFGKGGIRTPLIPFPQMCPWREFGINLRIPVGLGQVFGVGSAKNCQILWFRLMIAPEIVE